MEPEQSTDGNCPPPAPASSSPVVLLDKMPGTERETDEASCCGPPAGPAAGPDEKPGYAIRGFVEAFKSTPAGKVPHVKTRLSPADTLGTLLVRAGIGRNDYKVAPGLYALGCPDRDAPVLVTANYKLSFDHVRRELSGQDAWLLVLDTRGINVWCAAGKGTFATGELVKRIIETGLEKVVAHRKVIVPQLGATGVSSRKVKQLTGFEVVWGPIRAGDIVRFLENGLRADRAMRRVTFTLGERAVLIPVELSLVLKPTLWILLALFVLSGIGPGIFSLSAAWSRGLWAAAAVLLGILAGAGAAPLLLPWLRPTTFAAKGILTGLVLVLPAAIAAGASQGIAGFLAVVFMGTAISSYLAMNFTGTTPFTAPSGVEKEMRRFIPVQLGLAVCGVVLWVAAAF